MEQSPSSGLTLPVRISLLKLALLDGVDMLDAIRSPDDLHQESVARVNSQLDKALLLMRESQDPDTYRAEIVECAARLHSLNQEPQKSHALAEEFHKSEARDALHRVAHKLLKAMGLDLVREILGGNGQKNHGRPASTSNKRGAPSENLEASKTGCQTRATKRQRMSSNADGLQQSGEGNNFTGAAEQPRNGLSGQAGVRPSPKVNDPTTWQAPVASMHHGATHYPVHNGGTVQEDFEGLERMAAEVEAEARIKGKQIPPFVQKLSRQVGT